MSGFSRFQSCWPFPQCSDFSFLVKDSFLQEVYVSLRSLLNMFIIINIKLCLSLKFSSVSNRCKGLGEFYYRVCFIIFLKAALPRCGKSDSAPTPFRGKWGLAGGGSPPRGAFRLPGPTSLSLLQAPVPLGSALVPGALLWQRGTGRGHYFTWMP